MPAPVMEKAQRIEVKMAKTHQASMITPSAVSSTANATSYYCEAAILSVHVLFPLATAIQRWRFMRFAALEGTRTHFCCSYHSTALS